MTLQVMSLFSIRLFEIFLEVCNHLDQGLVNYLVKSNGLFGKFIGTQPGTFVYLLSMAAVVLWWNVEKL